MRKMQNPKYKTKLYGVWEGMKERCHNPKSVNYKNYGARGICMCDRWMKSSDAFIQDMGPSYKEGLSLDRIKNDGPYSPENCRWATKIVQCSNMRKNKYIEYKGEKLTIQEWSRRLGINRETLRYRFNNNWTAEECLQFAR